MPSFYYTGLAWKNGLTNEPADVHISKRYLRNAHSAGIKPAPHDGNARI